METTVYADVLFFVNFSMDFITLWISATLSSQKHSALKMSAAAAIGGLYGVLSVFIDSAGIVSIILCGIVSIVMALTAFGFSCKIRGLLKQSVLIWVCGALLGGVMTAFLSLGSSFESENQKSSSTLSFVIALSVVAVYVSARIICAAKDKKSVSVTATWHDRSVTFSALCDSGNLMRDPLSGSPVISVSSEIIQKLLGRILTDALLSLDGNTLSESGISLRIIPHRSDSSNDLLGGIVADSVIVSTDKAKKNVSCVLCPRNCKKDYFAGHAATLPTSLLP